MKKHFYFLFFILFGAFFGAQAQKKTDTVVKDIVLHTPTGDLFGTLEIPALKKKMPVVLIVPGSGPTDRDGNNMMIVNDAYKMLADSLKKYGIASLRYDKRAIGKSKAAVKSERDIRFDHYIPDVVGWIKMLKKDKRFSRVIVLGHDEGAVIAMYAFAQQKADAFISAEGPGESADKLMKKQLKEKIAAAGYLDSSYYIIDLLKSGKTIEHIGKPLMKLFRPDVQQYIISWFKFDPQTEIKKLSMPILIIQGTADLQITPENGKLLAEANPKARLVMMDSMNHVFRESTIEPVKNMESIMDARLPIKKEFTDAVIEFIRKN